MSTPRESTSRNLITVAAALHKTKQAVESIGAPPVKQDPETGKTVIKGEETDSWVTGSSFSIVSLVALTGLVTGILSWTLVTSYLVDVASLILVCVVAPTVVYQKHLLNKLGSFRHQHNILRHLVRTFQAENNRLAGTVDQLEKHAER